LCARNGAVIACHRLYRRLTVDVGYSRILVSPTHSRLSAADKQRRFQLLAINNDTCQKPSSNSSTLFEDSVAYRNCICRTVVFPRGPGAEPSGRAWGKVLRSLKPTRLPVSPIELTFLSFHARRSSFYVIQVLYSQFGIITDWEGRGPMPFSLKTRLANSSLQHRHQTFGVWGFGGWELGAT